MGDGLVRASCENRTPALICAFVLVAWVGMLSPASVLGCHGMPGWYWESFDGHWISTGAMRLDLEVDQGILKTMDCMPFVCGSTVSGEVWGYPGCPVDAGGGFSSDFGASSGESVHISGTLNKTKSSGKVQICVNGCCKSVALKRIGVLDVYGSDSYGVFDVEVSSSGSKDSHCSWDDVELDSIKLHREYFGDTTVKVTALCSEGMALKSWGLDYMPSDVPAKYTKILIDSKYANPATVSLKAGVWQSLQAYCGTTNLELSAGGSNPSAKMMQTIAPGAPVNAIINHVKLHSLDKKLILKRLTYTITGDGVPEGLTGGSILSAAKLHRDPTCKGKSAGVVGRARLTGNKLAFSNIGRTIAAGASPCYFLECEFTNKAFGTYGATVAARDVEAVDEANDRAVVDGGDVAGSLEVNLDTDGDGLLDFWETHGYDHDGDGVIDVNLPLMGANPRHKDIFVEIDWMRNATHSHKPRAATMKSVVKAFKNAPVENPDGVKGIALHLDSGNLGGGNAVAHSDDLKPLWTDFDAIKGANFDPKRNRIFRYCLFAHAYNSTTSSGYTRRIPGSDFVVTLGAFEGGVGTGKQQAGTFMHELGHSLGLRHGGSDNVNYKPNFLSIMNYFFQMDWLRYDGKDNKLDYSRLLVSDLKERHLDESKALESSRGDAALVRYGTRFFTVDRTQRITDESSADLDWNDNGVLDLDTSVDLNGDNKLGTLKGECNEWQNIEFKGGGVGSTEAAPAPPAEKEDELMLDLTLEEYQRMIRHSTKVNRIEF